MRPRLTTGVAALATAAALALPACSGTTPTGTRTAAAPVVATATTVARGLPVPWGLAFLPDGTALVTERDTARVVRLKPGATPVRVGTVPGVEPAGEGGLLGITVSPQFATDHTIFVYFTSFSDNRVLRMTLDGRGLRPDRVILSGIPKGTNHNGGRLAFGPDGWLYVTTGDAGNRTNGQNRGSLGGKILRVTTEGHPAPGNPFPGSPVWTLGHRNVQGIAWDASGRMYASEFGQDTWDELNVIRPGNNYGWPLVEGIAHRAGLVDPIVEWRPDVASPSGIAVGRDGAVYVAALRGEALWQVRVDSAGRAATPRRVLAGTYGRLRTVVTGPDGRLWLVTSNTFRGTPRAGDDKVVILPSTFGR
jgi:glucose/arabinose dehydrogenase